jgi:FkbM family methyltransferase
MPAPTRSLTAGEHALSLALRALPIRHGKHRVLDLVRATAWVDDDRPVVVPFGGTTVVMDTRDLIGWHFCVLRSFDPEVSEVLAAVGREQPEPVFWDIGANKGVCSYAVAAALPQARIVAVEPQPDLAERTRANLARLAPERCEVHAVGIGTAEGTFTLAVPAANLGAASFVIDPQRAHRTLEVPVITATMLRERSAHGWPTLVKIDVEGFEPEVVASLEPCLAEGACEAIVFENHHTNATSFVQVHGRLTAHGYRVFALRRNVARIWLSPATTTVAGAMDYVALHEDVLDRPAVRQLLRGQ